MAGIRDWIRNRSKSRSRASQDLKSQTKASEKEETKNLPPLPPTRADSTNNKRSEQGARQSTQVHHQPNRSLSPQGGYDSIPPGDAPRVGTFPHHGNANRPPSIQRVNSKSTVETTTARSLDSGSRRRSSGRPYSATGQSLPPGTAVTTDVPVASTTTPTSIQRQPVSALVANMYNSQSGQLDYRDIRGKTSNLLLTTCRCLARRTRCSKGAWSISASICNIRR